MGGRDGDFRGGFGGILENGLGDWWEYGEGMGKWEEVGVFGGLWLWGDDYMVWGIWWF